MRLSAEILIHHLEQFAEVEIRGPVGKDLVLERPLICRGKEDAAKENRLFLFPDADVAEEALRGLSFGKGTVLLCPEGTKPMNDFPGAEVSLVVLHGCRLTPVGLYDELQRFFNGFDRWEEDLRRVLETSADLNELLKVGEAVLGNPMKVIDAGYRCVAYSRLFDEREDLSKFRPQEDPLYSADQIAAIIGDQRIAHVLEGMLSFTIEGTEMRSFNLFEQKEYIGALTIYYFERDPQPGDEALGMYFSDVVRRAVLKHETLLNGRTRILRTAFQDALNDRTVEEAQIRYLEQFASREDAYLCLRVLASDETQKTLSVKYLCEMFENSLPGSVALSFKSSIVVLIRIRQPFSAEHVIVRALSEQLSQMQMKGALSDVFSDIRQIRRHYRQASIALDLGIAQDSDKSLYLFDDYALNYLISHSVGEFSPQLFLTDGLKRLIRHDEEALAKGTVGAVSYIDTLRVYLNHNMNLSRAAEELFIHKSSLLARLEKIRTLLQMDLEDPDVRLRLMILLKQLEYDEERKAGR